MRLFIAIDFPKEIKKEITASIDPLVKNLSKIRWAKEENLHLTLKFLGNIGNDSFKVEKKLQEIKKGIKKAISGKEKFPLQFEKFGFFDYGRFIIWLGLAKNKNLEELVAELEREMEKVGFKSEKRPFTPHMTIGKGKRLDKNDLEDFKNGLLNIDTSGFSPFLVKEITLFESKLHPEGAAYLHLEKFALV